MGISEGAPQGERDRKRARHGDFSRSTTHAMEITRRWLGGKGGRGFPGQRRSCFSFLFVHVRGGEGRCCACMYNGGGRRIDAHEELVVLAVEHGSRGEYFASPGLNVFCTRRKKGCFMTARRRGIDRSRGRGGRGREVWSRRRGRLEIPQQGFSLQLHCVSPRTT